MKATPMRSAAKNRRRSPTPWAANPILIVAVTVAAFLGAAVLGRGRIWPHGSRLSRQTTSEPAKSMPVASASIPSSSTATAPVEPRDAAANEAPPARMTLAQQTRFDAWLIKTYLRCWKPTPQPADEDPYVARVRLAYRPDGSLSKPPKLVNPPSDPALKPQAQSVMLAIQSCNPLPVPAQYRPFYEQWKTKTIHFDPQIATR